MPIRSCAAACADPDPGDSSSKRAGAYFKRKAGDASMAEAPSRSAERAPSLKAHGARTGLSSAWGDILPASKLRGLQDEGHDVPVLDLRWLAPLDWEAVAAATKAAGGKVLVLHEATMTGGFGAEIVARLHERLDGPLTVRRLATPDVRMPASAVLQSTLVPDRETIAEAVRALVQSR